MKIRAFCLRVASVALAMFAFWQIARLWAGIDWVILHYRPGHIVNLASIVIAGGLSIGLMKLSGPWWGSVDPKPPESS